jgi:hypothetical protein
MEHEDLVKFWYALDAKVSSIGSATHARKCRNRYFASDITDERYEKIYAIVASEVRQAMESEFEKWNVSPDDLEAVSRIKRSRMPKPPKATEWAATAPAKAPTGSVKGRKSSSGLVVRDAEMPSEFDE